MGRWRVAEPREVAATLAAGIEPRESLSIETVHLGKHRQESHCATPGITPIEARATKQSEPRQVATGRIWQLLPPTPYALRGS